MSDPANYEEEARLHHAAIDSHATIPIETVLELGCGGGNNAVHMKAHYDLTLSDRSEGMLEASRALNPECEQYTAHNCGEFSACAQPGNVCLFTHASEYSGSVPVTALAEG